jgi:Fic family protein
MWNDINFDNIQVSKALRNKCNNFENQLYLYDKEVFQEMEDARHIYGSLKTEGSTLTFDQTSMLLKGEIPRNAKNRDLLEGLHLANALREVRNLVGSVPFSEEVVKRIHKTCANGLLSVDESGEYRKRQNYVGRGNYLTAAPNQIDKLMGRLFTAIALEPNPIVRAGFFAFNFLSIHPFIDFNGRTSRLFECYILGEAGFPFISLKEEQIESYLTLLREGQERGKAYFEPYIEFVYQRVEERFDEIRRDAKEYQSNS